LAAGFARRFVRCARDRAPSVEFGFCEGCGATSIPTADLRQIDSGQFLCPDCLHTLRVEALQAEWDALAESLA
jgi:NifB/MoaA-like Fe-S oxidoreductase